MNDREWLEQASISARNLAEVEFDRDKLAQQLIQVLRLSVAGNAAEVAAIAPGTYL